MIWYLNSFFYLMFQGEDEIDFVKIKKEKLDVKILDFKLDKRFQVKNLWDIRFFIVIKYYKLVIIEIILSLFFNRELVIWKF